jgi:hypothetical protein
MQKGKNGRRTGGVDISRSRVTVHGDIVGVDKVSGSEMSRVHVDQLFQPFTDAIQMAPLETRQEASEKMTALKKEIGRGKQANDSVMAKLLDGLVKLVPNGIGALTKIFATPILADLTGPVTQFVLSKIQGG